MTCAALVFLGFFAALLLAKVVKMVSNGEES